MAPAATPATTVAPFKKRRVAVKKRARNRMLAGNWELVRNFFSALSLDLNRRR
jgi:hypothetical protein